MADKCPRCGYKLNPNGLSAEKIQQMRQNYPKAFTPWTPEDDKMLVEMVQAQKNTLEMAHALGRQVSAVYKRITMLDIKLAPITKEPSTEVNYLDRSSEPSKTPA